ncbi:MAG: hypothetical protein IH987_09005, partial [Planctomycetes bacterium]|nr:hypothetical protein [Planctomycetota bacterium]
MNKPCLLIFGGLICGFGPLGSVRGEYVYWGFRSQDPQMQRADLDSDPFKPEAVINGFGLIEEIAVDVTRGKVYWISTELPEKKLVRANLDGSGQQTLNNSYVLDFWLSEDGAEIYLGARPSPNTHVIFRITIATRSRSTIYTFPEGEEPDSISVDLGVGKIYWTTLLPSQIGRVDLDGNNAEILITGANQPTDIELDLTNRKMYWINRTQGSVSRASLDGTDVEVVLASSNNATAITLDVDGAYVVQLVVNDGTVNSVAESVTINATTGNSAPGAPV